MQYKLYTSMRQQSSHTVLSKLDVLASRCIVKPLQLLLLSVCFSRIKEEPSSEIQFPVFDENDDITDEHLLQLEG